MDEQLVVRNNLRLALMAVLQRSAPGLLAGGGLYLVKAAYGFPPSGELDLLAALAALLLVMLPRQRRTSETAIFARSVPLALWAVARWGIALAILLALGYATKATQDYPRRVILTWAMLMVPVQIAITVLLDSVTVRVLRDPANARKTVFVGCNEVSMALAGQLRANAGYCMAVEGFFDDRKADRLLAGDPGGKLLGSLSELAAYVNMNRVEVIFVALPMRHLQRVRDLLEELRDTTASIYYVPDIFVFDLIQSRTGDINGMPVVALCETPFYGMRGVAKRLTDIVIATGAVLLLSPLLLAVMLAIRVTSAGPAIFRQRRYGLDGREITVYKFRTMYVTEDRGAILQATRDDRRVTPIGRFLRRYSIDELPQLVNVLQGRMSLVGPRPHAIAHNEEYRKLIKGYMVRHKVQPGMTGLAQVNGCRGETSQLEQMEARVRYDLDYLRRWSLLLDLRILAATAVMLFSDDRAY
jgi:putative colanic acid biosysnthesis UDP-glucose lipid carrier transferase